ncbi:Cdc73p NDAI_0J02630 [Naumovozyma dairenensis CBS 421]|uniref:Cell division control protein 73 C-terminal domain-containing protein n=1 Tax=Naumovozyma dairenensis (strain ATCC 10597 / BCRC 20456 / CBS 421 / NBRC 0211 / NRRL Y-12639) TaxID=1071378 RepID=G0WH77_NAUDC|nr:hypothetical protein NDAI_0J02630 [Naumovozyma dairenensis CBS 421]CCD27155.1 hypothetical protein NDAI_0J02630 [Naumovozyma dairenensis CBS 421]
MSSATVLVRVRDHLKNKDKFTLLNNGDITTEDIREASKISFNDSDDIFSLEESTEFGGETPLKVIIHCWLHMDSSAADYLADCEKRQLPNISFLQRNDLINWLSGKSDSSQYLETEETKTKTAITDDKSVGETTTTKLPDRKDMIDDPVLIETLKHERPLLDQNSSLRGSKPINFGYLIKDAELKLVQTIKNSLKGSKHNKAGHVTKASSSLRKQRVVHKDPIILIPSAASSIFSVSNIKQFLQDSKYVNPRDLSISMNSANDIVTVEKKFDTLAKPLRFLIVNNTRMFTKAENWDRLVAVFTTGHTWQFNNYQWNTPQELFQHCKGYYFHFTGDAVPQHVQQWNVEKIELDKNKRFKDIEVVRYFWNSLEKELIARGYR